MIDFDHLSKVFRSRDGANVVALEDVSLTVTDNEFILSSVRPDVVNQLYCVWFLV